MKFLSNLFFFSRQNKMLSTGKTIVQNNTKAKLEYFFTGAFKLAEMKQSIGNLLNNLIKDGKRFDNVDEVTSFLGVDKNNEDVLKWIRLNPQVNSVLTRTGIKIDKLEREGMMSKNDIKHIDKTAKERRLIVYTSKNPYVNNIRGQSNNLNLKAHDINNSLIACRQLSYQQLRIVKNYPFQFKNKEAIENIDNLKQNIFDNNNIKYRADNYYFFECKNIGIQIYEIVRNLPKDSAKSMMFYSENHAMAITIKHKPDGAIALKFFDPNETHVHKRALFEDVNAIKNLLISDLIQPENQEIYFPKFKSGCIAMYNNLEIDALKPKSTNKLEFSKGNLMPVLLSEILHVALDMNDPEAVRYCIDGIKNSQLSIEEKCEFLEAADDNGVPGLFKALQEGHAEVIECYMAGITKCRFLSDQYKQELFNAMTVSTEVKYLTGNRYKVLESRTTGLFMAFQNNRSTAIKIFMAMVKKSKLPVNIQEDLLAGWNLKLRSNPQSESKNVEALQKYIVGKIPSLYVAFHQNNIDAINAGIDGIYNSGLPKNIMLSYLKAYAKGPNYNGPEIAEIKGHKAALEAYKNKIKEKFFCKGLDLM